MAFRAAFIAHAPYADPEKHRCVVETETYKLTVVLVRDQRQAVEVSRALVEEEGVHSVILCPGFTHGDVAEISEAVKGKAGVFVARGDGPSSRLTAEVRRREGLYRGRE